MVQVLGYRPPVNVSSVTAGIPPAAKRLLQPVGRWPAAQQSRVPRGKVTPVVCMWGGEVEAWGEGIQVVTKAVRMHKFHQTNAVLDLAL